MGKMKKIWNCLKKIILPLVLILLLISATFIIFGLKEINISDKIQAWAIVTLILITAIYSYQTYRLVKQQEKALDEEKRKRIADFAIKGIKEFYSPLLKMIEGLHASLKTDVIPIESTKKIIKKIILLCHDYLYMMDENDAIIDFTKTLMDFGIVILEQKQKLQDWRSKVLDGEKEIINQMSVKIVFFREKIIETYGYSNKEMMDELEKTMKAKN